LAEEEGAFSLGIPPVVNERPGDRGHADIPALTPDRYPFTDPVDEFVGLDALTEPITWEDLLSSAPLWWRNRYEVRTDPAGVRDLAGNPVIRKDEVPAGFVVWRVEDGILD